MIGMATLDKIGLFKMIFFSRDYWFVKSYLLLYILSPLLNVAAENTPRLLFRNVLILYYIFQTIFGWAYPVSVWSTFADGYSPISLIGLYLTARYCRIYRPKVTQMSLKFDISVILLIIVSVTMLYMLPSLFGINNVLIGKKLLSYISPTTIIYGLFMVVAFTKIEFTSKAINWCASSAFAIYLIHMNPNVNIYFKEIIVYLHNEYSLMIFIFLSILFLLIIYFSSILIDRIRLYLWRILYYSFTK